MLVPDDDGHLATRALADGRVLFVMPLTYGRARLGIGPDFETPWLDDEW